MNSVEDKGGLKKNYDRRSAVFISYCQFRESALFCSGWRWSRSLSQECRERGLNTLQKDGSLSHSIMRTHSYLRAISFGPATYWRVFSEVEKTSGKTRTQTVTQAQD